MLGPLQNPAFDETEEAQKYVATEEDEGTT